MNNLNKKQKTDFEGIISLISEARNRAFQSVNAELVSLYFRIGGIVSRKVEAGNWGDGTVDELAEYIQAKYPGLKGFNRRGIYRMKQFYEAYAGPEFVSPLMAQIQRVENELLVLVPPVVTQVGWTHHLLILSKTKTPQEKLFYIQQCINDRLSKRELERQLNSAVYERTSIGNKTASSQSVSFPAELFKDPYIFEFLDLPEGHSEHDLEAALVHNLRQFILEIGKGFAYMGNQHRIQVGNKDYYTDLLFYNRDLQCLVLFELKVEEFAPEFLGKLNFYLEALDRDVKRPHENASVGVLLCKGKDNEVVEYAMARNTSPAMIADYETKLIPKDLLASKLHQLAEQLTAGAE
ncbi:PDDEXK nuclease domain-containing protein [Chitinophaga sp.]|uniref:PDDEXK nuclease domain-containing protein n=1 Tax=Chitinophaga sp. TaxID=1869181 RepID=UPI0031E39377